jgi:type IV pilus assembly protein PilE
MSALPHPCVNQSKGHSARGFTLIELLVVMVIVSILAAVAIPGYSTYTLRSRLTDATSTLASFRLRMEQSYQDNGNFGTAGCSVSLSASSNFSYSCALSNSGQGFTATATGTGSTAGYSYSIDETGQRRTLAFPRVGAASCWVVRAGSCS